VGDLARVKLAARPVLIACAAKGSVLLAHAVPVAYLVVVQRTLRHITGLARPPGVTLAVRRVKQHTPPVAVAVVGALVVGIHFGAHAPTKALEARAAMLVCVVVQAKVANTEPAAEVELGALRIQCAIVAVAMLA
jgi:hypothetical protein